MHPGDDGAGLAGIAKHRSTLSTNKSAPGATLGSASLQTGRISLGQTSRAHKAAATLRSYGDRDRSMDADYRRQ